MTFVVEREGKELEIEVEGKWVGQIGEITYNRRMVGLMFAPGTPDVGEFWQMAYIPPTQLVRDVVEQTFRTLRALTIDRAKTGVGPDKLMGPVGIATNLKRSIDVDLRLGLWLLVLLNINLAILNMLPLPVLDGGHITFALIQVVTRRPLPPKVINTLQNAFVLLLLGFIMYVTFHDVRRLMPVSKADREAAIERSESLDRTLKEDGSDSSDAAPE